VNTNCLEGFKCPKCGYERRFDIAATSIFTFTDDGEDEHFDVEWEDHSYCKCCDCDFASTVSHFRGGKPTEDPKVAALKSFCSTIDVTGGLNAEGNPVADEEWIDLGDAYAEACEVLNRKPTQERETDGS
jgi:hypothetical protein